MVISLDKATTPNDSQNINQANNGKQLVNMTDATATSAVTTQANDTNVTTQQNGDLLVRSPAAYGTESIQSMMSASDTPQNAIATMLPQNALDLTPAFATPSALSVMSGEQSQAAGAMMPAAQNEVGAGAPNAVLTPEQSFQRDEQFLTQDLTFLQQDVQQMQAGNPNGALMYQLDRQLAGFDEQMLRMDAQALMPNSAGEPATGQGGEATTGQVGEQGSAQGNGSSDTPGASPTGTAAESDSSASGSSPCSGSCGGCGGCGRCGDSGSSSASVEPSTGQTSKDTIGSGMPTSNGSTVGSDIPANNGSTSAGAPQNTGEIAGNNAVPTTPNTAETSAAPSNSDATTPPSETPTNPALSDSNAAGSDSTNTASGSSNPVMGGTAESGGTQGAVPNGDNNFFQGGDVASGGDPAAKPTNGYDINLGVTPGATTGAQSPEGSDANTSPSSPPAGKNWVLTFNDNFSSGNSDVSNDSVANGSNWTNHSWYSGGTTDASVQDGALSIPSNQSSDGSLMTINGQGQGFTQKYGYFEASIWQPTDTTHWDGFWMMSDAHAQSISNPALNNAASSEIDIMEQNAAWGNTNSPSGSSFMGTVHEDSYGPRGDDYQNPNNGINVPNVDLSAGWHTYGVDWEPSGVTYYVDGKPVLDVNASQYPSLNSSPMFMVLSNGNGGSGDMKVAWVKAYQNADLVNSTDDADTPATTG